MRILAHFKDRQLLHRRDLAPLVAGSYLRDDAVEDILRILHERKLITGRVDGQKWRAGKSLYRGITF